MDDFAQAVTRRTARELTFSCCADCARWNHEPCSAPQNAPAVTFEAQVLRGQGEQPALQSKEAM